MVQPAYRRLVTEDKMQTANDAAVAANLDNEASATHASAVTLASTVAHEEFDATVSNKVDKGEIVLNAQDFGIVGDGTTQDITALNAKLASTAGSVSVYFPPSSDLYQFDTPLHERDNVTIYGDGQDTIIRWRGSAMLFPAGNMSGWTFRDITADVSGAGANLITLINGGGLSRSEFIRCELRTYVDDGSVVYLTGEGNFTNNKFERTSVRRRASATVPAIYISTTKSGVNSLGIDGGMWFSNGVTTPMIYIENTSGASYCNNMAFVNMIGEQSAGGLVHMYAANGITVRNCVDYDQTTYTDDLLLFDTAGGLDSQAVDVDGCGTAGAPVTFPAGKGHLTVTGSGQAHRIGRVFRGGRNGYVNIPGQGRAVVNNGGPALSLREVVGNRTLDTYDHVILASQTGTITLPDPTADVNGGTLPVGREFIVKNVGTATTTVACDGSSTVDGSPSLSLAQGEVARVVTDGTNWWTI